MIRIIFLIGQPGIGKSSLSMGLEQALQDSFDLCVIQNRHDRDYRAEQNEAVENGFASMQDPGYKREYGKKNLEQSRKEHGKRIVASYNQHNEENSGPFVVLLHIPVRTTLEHYKWCEEDYQSFIQQAGYEGEISFLPSLILAPDPKKHSDEQVIAILKQRHEERCQFKEMETDQPETDPEKIDLQRALDAALPVEAQLEQVKLASRELDDAVTLYLDLEKTPEKSRARLLGTLSGIIKGEQTVAQLKFLQQNKLQK
jgi:hypothetical protein